MEEGIIGRLTDRGFGFIARVDTDKDIFFHSADLRGITFEELREGDFVEFQIAGGTHGPIAINVMRGGIRSWRPEKIEPESEKAQATISEVIEGFHELTPELIQHLRRHNSDIEKVNSSVFEHLVGELMASAGWDEVRLVGRNPLTHADILAIHYTPNKGGIPVRFFVEIKRWKTRIGVEVFNQVIGAMVSERERYGWHGAIIVALGGASNTRSFSRDQYRKKGLEVKDKEDVLRWLRDYKPNADGLWIPPHFTGSLDYEH